MCKKHHDEEKVNLTGPPGSEEQPAVSTIVKPKKVRSSSKLSFGSTGSSKKPGHTRGLSIFQEISPDAVGDLLSGDPATATAAKNATANGTRKVTATASAAPKRPPNHHHRSTVSQILVDIGDTEE